MKFKKGDRVKYKGLKTSLHSRIATVLGYNPANLASVAINFDEPTGCEIDAAWEADLGAKPGYWWSTDEGYLTLVKPRKKIYWEDLLEKKGDNNAKV